MLVAMFFFFKVASYLALLEDDIPILYPAYKALIGWWLSPLFEKVVKWFLIQN